MLVLINSLISSKYNTYCVAGNLGALQLGTRSRSTLERRLIKFTLTCPYIIDRNPEVSVTLHYFKLNPNYARTILNVLGISTFRSSRSRRPIDIAHVLISSRSRWSLSNQTVSMSIYITQRWASRPRQWHYVLDRLVEAVASLSE